MRTKVGYTGGTTPSPTYHNLGDHTETVTLEYDPSETSYQKLLALFWRHHSPTVQRTRQYMSAIFYHDEEQLRMAENTKSDVQASSARPIVTKILPAETFYDAENYHQKFMLRNNSALLNSLNLDNSQIITSHVATRLNGYLAGHKKQQFEQEWKSLGLSQEQADFVRQQI